MKNSTLQKKVKKDIGYVYKPEELASISGFARKSYTILKENKTTALQKAQKITDALQIALGVIYSNHERAVLVLCCAQGILEELTCHHKELSEQADELGDRVSKFIDDRSKESIFEVDMCVGRISKSLKEVVEA